jgi:hypothetical protein
MNIYSINWDQGGYGLSAVVIANTEDEAVSLLDLDDEYETDVEADLIGKSTNSSETPRVVVRESL